MIFVFGSNLMGIHGAGAANVALRERGAKWGTAEGLMGTAYALPTKETPGTKMNLEEINRYVQNFMKYAHMNPAATFLVTQVGCGLGGYLALDIAPMFRLAAHEKSNLRFDSAWKYYLPSTAKFWGTF